VRVVFLTHTYPRWAGDSVGAELACLARALIRRGISVRVIAPGEVPGISQADGVPVHWVRTPLKNGVAWEADRYRSALRGPASWSRVVRLWRSLREAARRELAAGADVVHAHGWAPAGLAAPADLPLVVTVRNSDGAFLRHSRMAAALGRRLLRRAAVVTAVSRPVGEAIQTVAGRFVGPTHIHPMPVESRGLPWSRGGRGAVVISPLTTGGRVELALQTSSVLASHGHELSLTIIGDGPGRAALEQRAAQLGVSALTRFVGEVSPEQIRDHLIRADLLLITGQGDATATAALQALIAGVPVVACWDSGAAIDLVPQSGAGRLCLPSADVIADNILSLLGDRDRISMSRLVGEAWRARVAPDHVAQLCAGWYREALAT
jgi:glycosyltransferase involved in cell wall biosynthesis